LALVDWLGSLLIAGIWTGFVTAITFGGAIWPWSDGRFIATITVTAVLIPITILQQYFGIHAKQPIFPGHLLKSRTMLLLYFGSATTATAQAVGAYFIPLYFQFVQHDSALKAAVRLLPFIVVMIVLVLMNGTLLPMLSVYQIWYIASGVFITIGGALMFTIDVDTSTSKVYGYSVLVAIGVGLTLQAGYTIAQAKVPPHQVPSVISFMNVAQIGTIVIALTIAGTVFQNVGLRNLENALDGYGYGKADLAGAVAGTKSAIFAHGSPEVRRLALKAIIDAMDDVFVLILVAGAFMVLSSLAMKFEKVDLPKVEL
jgi:hypothetical protein